MTGAGWLLVGVGIALGVVMANWWRRRWLVVTVDGVSMQPTYTIGDRLLVRRASIGQVRRGMVVVLRQVDDGGELMIKRVSALPGDRPPEGIPVSDEFVPAGCVVVLGDNAAHSYDSRRVGYLRQDAVIGIVIRPIHARP